MQQFSFFIFYVQNLDNVAILIFSNIQPSAFFGQETLLRIGRFGHYMKCQHTASHQKAKKNENKNQKL